MSGANDTLRKSVSPPLVKQCNVSVIMYLTNARGKLRKAYNLVKGVWRNQPMARFQSGVWHGHFVKAMPTNFWRKILPYGTWTYPYNIGSKVGFSLEMSEPVEQTFFLGYLPIYYRYTETGEAELVTSKDRYNRTYTGTFMEYPVPSSGALEIWLGEPNKGGSTKLVHADAINPTTTILSVISAVLIAVVLLQLGLK
jgi:hypothetical protein